MKNLSKIICSGCFVCFLLVNGAQHSPLSFVPGSPKGKVSSSTQMWGKKYFRHQMNTECTWNVEMTPQIKILSIWRARKMYPLFRNVIFRRWIPGDFGLHMQLFFEKPKFEKSVENEVSGISKSVFRRKWCAALSSVVCHGGPEGQENRFNANVVEQSVLGLVLTFRPLYLKN